MYKNLVLGRDDLLGMSYLGVLDMLDDMGLLNDIVRFAGSSGGSIIATFLACGADISFLHERLNECDIGKLYEDSWFPPTNTYNILTYYGICSGSYLYKWLGQILCDLVDDPDITFRGLWVYYERELIITGTNMDTGTTQYYSRHTEPMMPIRTAIRISMSYPFLYQSVESDEGHVLIDGSLFNFYPINAFDHSLYISEYTLSINDGVNPETLGVKLISSHPMRGKACSGDIKGYIICIIDAFNQQGLRLHIDSKNWKRTITVDVKNIHGIDTNLNILQKQELIQQGKIGVRKFFNTNDKLTLLNHALISLEQ